MLGVDAGGEVGGEPKRRWQVIELALFDAERRGLLIGMTNPVLLLRGSCLL